jgi:hypothetical protein
LKQGFLAHPRWYVLLGFTLPLLAASLLFNKRRRF